MENTLRKTFSHVWFGKYFTENSLDHFTENDLESDPKNRPSMNEVLEELEKINAIKEKVAEPKHNPKPNKRKEDRHQHHQNHGVNRAGARA